jgi:hypothetical protein
MRLVRAALAVAALVCLASAAQAVTPWTSDPTFADTAKNFGTGVAPLYPAFPRDKGPICWGPRDESAASPPFFLESGKITFTWHPNATGGSGSTVTLTVERSSGVEAGPWTTFYQPVTAAGDCSPGNDTCNTFVADQPGWHRFVPSAQAANGRVCGYWGVN